MNKQRRKTLAEAVDLLYKAVGMIEDVQSDEQDAYDNLPEGIQSSERGEEMQEYAEKLEKVADAINEQISEIEDIL